MKKKDVDSLKKLLEDEKKRISHHLQEISESSVADSIRRLGRFGIVRD